MLIVDKHCNGVCCDELSVPQIDSKNKTSKRTVTWTILFAISNRYFKHRKDQNLWMNNKVTGD